MPFPNSSEHHSWETPPEVFAPLDSEFRFTLDVCATNGASRCEAWFTPDQDGLAQDWGRERCWLNPPYGRDVGKWIAKASRAAAAGALVVALVYARTDTRWWHDYVWDAECHAPRAGVEVRFLKGRVWFLRDGRRAAPATAPSVVVIFWPRGAESIAELTSLLRPGRSDPRAWAAR